MQLHPKMRTVLVRAQLYGTLFLAAVGRGMWQLAQLTVRLYEEQFLPFVRTFLTITDQVIAERRLYRYVLTDARHHARAEVILAEAFEHIFRAAGFQTAHPRPGTRLPDYVRVFAIEGPVHTGHCHWDHGIPMVTVLLPLDADPLTVVHEAAHCLDWEKRLARHPWTTESSERVAMSLELTVARNLRLPIPPTHGVSYDATQWVRENGLAAALRYTKTLWGYQAPGPRASARPLARPSLPERNGHMLPVRMNGQAVGRFFDPDAPLS